MERDKVAEPAGGDRLPVITFGSGGSAIRNWGSNPPPGIPTEQRLVCYYADRRCHRDCVALQVVEGINRVTGQRIWLAQCQATGQRLGQLLFDKN